MHTPLSCYDPIAPRYDRARPTYPAALFDDIADYARLGEASRLLEIGCGTGQATLPLAERGCAIDCIEVGEKMAAIARQKLARFPKVSVLTADFETVALPARHYDLVYAATAFHWIDPAVAFSKPHRLLKPGGALALFWHRPALTTSAANLSMPSKRSTNASPPELIQDYKLPPHPDDVTTEYAERIPASGLFHQLAIRKHYCVINYSAESYIDLLGTHSDHIKTDSRYSAKIIRANRRLDRDAIRRCLAARDSGAAYLARRK